MSRPPSSPSGSDAGRSSSSTASARSTLVIKASRASSASGPTSACARGSQRGAPESGIDSTGDRSKFGLTSSRDRRGRRPPCESEGHARLPRAAALPHRFPDHRHPRPQGRARRGEPDLRRPPRARRAAVDARRGRRPRRRLRRLADQLPLVEELLHPGVRQRRRERRSRKPATSADIAAPGHRHRGRALPWWRITRCSCSTCSACTNVDGRRPEARHRGRVHAVLHDLAEVWRRSRRTSSRPTTTSIQLKEEAATLFSLG